jgi:hypothetical protein
MDNVTGGAYKSAKTSIDLIEQAIQERRQRPFSSYDECNSFAEANNLNLMAYSPSAKSFFHVTHRGELLIEREWIQMYGSVLSYVNYEESHIKKVVWKPDSYLARANALVVGEQGNGIREPLYERDYFLPIGYRNPNTGCFNVAHPFEFFAVDHGVDVSYIYELLQHIAGENYKHLLGWLRQKMLYPKDKTEVVPVFTGMQGTGKSSFGEAICTAMFGQQNVIVTHSFDGTARFNSDQTDRLVVCIEEKTQNDKNNATSILKSLATTKTIRKENKGLDPFYQDSHTEYVLTTNELVPIKFDNMNQRRFMVMETDPDFARVKKGSRESETNRLADEVFTKIYGYTRDHEKVGEPLWNNKEDIEQFKYNLLKDTTLPNPKDFVETDAFKRCFSIPRTIETIEIESIIKGLAPFIALSLTNKQIVKQMSEYKLSDITPYEEGLSCFRPYMDIPFRIGINRMLVFQDKRGNPFSHASIDKVVSDLRDWLRDEYGIQALVRTEPPSKGFKDVNAKYRFSPALYFCLIEESSKPAMERIILPTVEASKAHGRLTDIRKRFGATYQPDAMGCFEVLNPLDETGIRSELHTTTKRFFLLEADTAPPDIKQKEKARLKDGITAEELYKERLDIQKSEANRLINAGIVQRAVYSGAKSIHMIIEIEDEPLTKEERRWLDAHLKTTLSSRLVFDYSTSDAARLTRAPVTCDRVEYIDGVEVHGVQCLLRENKNNVYDLNWRPLYNHWLSAKKAAYEEGATRKLLPTKAIYKSAAIALLDGTFWSNNEWDGKRNSVFFTAYRLVRSMGHSEEVVWNAITEDIRVYYKPSEIHYWMSRRTGTLIRQIEEELENCQT